MEDRAALWSAAASHEPVELSLQQLLILRGLHLRGVLRKLLTEYR
jgi:hypothetical protein